MPVYHRLRYKALDEAKFKCEVKVKSVSEDFTIFLGCVNNPKGGAGDPESIFSIYKCGYT